MPDDRDDRPSRYEDNGLVVYRASALGSCPKVLVAIGQGMTPEPFPRWLLERFDQGIEGEPVVLERLREMGWSITGQQKLVEVPVGSGLLIRGHLDSLGLPPRETHLQVVEVKCVSEGYRDQIVRELPPMYMWQMAIYGRVERKGVTLVLGVKDKDGRVAKVEVIPVEVPGLAAVKIRVMGIERHIADGTWPRCSYRQWPCPFPELCDDPVPEPTEDWELEDRLRESVVHVRH